MTPESRSFAYYLKGASSSDIDMYVMINAHWEGLEFDFMEPGPCTRIINTFLAPPVDFLTEPDEIIQDTTFFVGGRSVVLFIRHP